MAEEGTVVPGESEGSSLSPVEQKATLKGWKPREESDLPEEDWVDAKEFLGRQKLYDKIHDLKSEITKQGRSFQQEMSQVDAHFAKMQQVEFDKAMKQLKVEKQIAAEESNIVAVEQINDEIQQKEKEFEAQKQVAKRDAQTYTQEAAQEFKDWRESEEHKWFDSDKDIQKEAIAIGIGYAQINPNKTQLEVLAYTEKMIKSAYPERFQQTQGKKQVSDNTVESGGITANSGLKIKKSKGLTKADLNDQELSVMKTLVKMNALKTKADKNKISQEDQYLRDLSEAKELR